ncbi:MAG: histidine phosphatase family protein [Gammaproteobacteria bacterium]
MKRLTLVRHGNADWKNAGVADFDRPLNKRGIGEAQAMGKLLLDQELVPDLLLASAAKRTQLTSEILARKLNLAPRRVKGFENLYLAQPEDILTLIRATGPRVQHLAIVGHNPGISELARMLAPPDVNVVEMTTGAACTLTFTARTWETIEAPAARAVMYAPPKQLFSLFS